MNYWWRRCAMCDEWYNPRDTESCRIHRHPEPQSGPLRDNWLQSGMPFERWITETSEGRQWSTAQEARISHRNPSGEVIEAMNEQLSHPEPPDHPRFVKVDNVWYFLGNDLYEERVDHLVARSRGNLKYDLQAQDMINCAVAAWYRKTGIMFTKKPRADYFKALSCANEWLALEDES